MTAPLWWRVTLHTPDRFTAIVQARTFDDAVRTVRKRYDVYNPPQCGATGHMVNV